MHEGSVLASKYRLISLLGRGGMGSVWRAEHLDLRAPVAVKLLDPVIAASSEGLTRFHREARAAAALRSPHVVQIFDRGIDESTGQPYIVMELMEGESLAARIVRKVRLSAGETSRVITHIARALARAHDAGIVHRDLKPDNVFLVRNEDEEIAKVLDFGIAKTAAYSIGQEGGTRTGAVMGTPYYMSPEQISGSKAVDYRADLWALGVIACECLTGRRPFEADSIGGLALKICAEPMPRPSALGPVPRDFDAWFERAASRDPAGRFQSAREAADELRRSCESPSPAGDRPAAALVPPMTEVQTASTSALVRTTPHDERVVVPMQRVSGWLIRAGLGVAAGTIVTVLVSFGSRDEPRPDHSASAPAAQASPVAAIPPAPKPADIAPPSSYVQTSSTAPRPGASTKTPSEKPTKTPAPTATVKSATKRSAPALPRAIGTTIDERE
jgi:serine/threonine protein kinase